MQTVQSQPLQGPPTPSYSCCWVPALSFGAAVALAAYLLHKRERRVAVKEEPDMDLQAPLHPEDPRHHQVHLCFGSAHVQKYSLGVGDVKCIRKQALLS